MISTITQPPFIVDTVAEMDILWPSGSFVFCQSNNCIYELKSGAFVLVGSNYLYKSYDITTTSGISTIYLTIDGTSTGNPLFTSIDYIHIDFITNDPNLGKSFALTNSNKTLTITAVKQAFSGVSVLGINVLGSVTIPAAPNGTALKVLVQGTPA